MYVHYKTVLHCLAFQFKEHNYYYCIKPMQHNIVCDCYMIILRCVLPTWPTQQFKIKMVKKVQKSMKNRNNTLKHVALYIYIIYSHIKTVMLT